METITVGQVFTAVFSIKLSAGNNAVSYTVYRASNGVLVASGNAQYINGISWKVLFTPLDEDVFVIEVFDQSLNIRYSKSFWAVSASRELEPDSSYTTADMLAQVNAAISARLKGGAVASYSINGRNIQYMPMPELMALKKDLQKQLAAESGGSRNFAKFVRP